MNRQEKINLIREINKKIELLQSEKRVIRNVYNNEQTNNFFNNLS